MDRSGFCLPVDTFGDNNFSCRSSFGYGYHWTRLSFSRCNLPCSLAPLVDKASAVCPPPEPQWKTRLPPWPTQLYRHSCSSVCLRKSDLDVGSGLQGLQDHRQALFESRRHRLDRYPDIVFIPRGAVDRSEEECVRQHWGRCHHPSDCPSVGLAHPRLCRL